MCFFDESVTLDNRAQNGRSTARSSVAENRWQPVASTLREDDYVFTQFGHNDEAENSPDRSTSPEHYSQSLIRFVTETRSKRPAR